MDNSKDIDVEMNMYKLTEISENYLQIFGSLLQYNRDQPALTDDDNIIDFPFNDDSSLSFKYKKDIQLVGNEMIAQIC